MSFSQHPSQAAFGIPGTILVPRGFFRSLPADLEDTSYIDDYTTFWFFWRELFPLAIPALAANSASNLVGSWNTPFLPLVVLDVTPGDHAVLGSVLCRESSRYGFVVIVTIPAVVFYLLAERCIVAGLTGGAVKGWNTFTE